MGILICGLNGTGKSTLGRVLADRIGYDFIDNEDLFFPKTDEAYTFSCPRSKEDVIRLLEEKINKSSKFVFSAVKGDYGEKLIASLDQIVLIEVPKEIRSQRVRERSFSKFGERITPGGDLYDRETAWFSLTDSRPEDYTTKWLETVNCPVIRVDGALPVEENVKQIMSIIMPEGKKNPICDSIQRMTNEIVTVMDGDVYGLWLYGSVILDDFQLGWSDIDFIALTNGTISESQAGRLLMLRQNMLEKESGNQYYRSFEGVIASLDEFREQSFSRLIYWGTSGQRVASRYTLDSFSAFELAKYGKCIYGSRQWILPAPGREELIQAVRDHYECIRKYAVQTDERLYSCGWLLDIARCIYTLRHNDVIAKTQAGIWALNEHVFSDELPLRKTIEIRQNPSAATSSENVKQWLKSLGPVVQSYADVLEHELQNV